LEPHIQDQIPPMLVALGNSSTADLFSRSSATATRTVPPGIPGVYKLGWSVIRGRLPKNSHRSWEPPEGLSYLGMRRPISRPAYGPTQPDRPSGRHPPTRLNMAVLKSRQSGLPLLSTFGRRER
jgi:hypothetical protein